MSMCNHPNISSFLTSFLSGKDVWLVLPLYEAGSIAEIIKTSYQNGISNEAIIAHFLRSVLQALQYLHSQGKVHRDVKCGNFLLNSQGQLFLSDLGICIDLDEAKKSVKFAGTPCWMAPELLIKSSNYDYKNDIWSVGVCGLELAEGKIPFTNMNTAQAIQLIIESAPPDLQEPRKWSKDFHGFLNDCLKKNPIERLTAEELLTKHVNFFNQAEKVEEDLVQLIQNLPNYDERIRYSTLV